MDQVDQIEVIEMVKAIERHSYSTKIVIRVMIVIVSAGRGVLVPMNHADDLTTHLKEAAYVPKFEVTLSHIRHQLSL